MSSEHLVVTRGDDPLTKPILDYLERTYGMPASDIRGATLVSQVGEVQTLELTIMVRKDGGMIKGGAMGPGDTAIIRPVNPNVMPREWPDA